MKFKDIKKYFENFSKQYTDEDIVETYCEMGRSLSFKMKYRKGEK